MPPSQTPKSAQKSQFLLKGLTQKQREFLKNYDGATSITGAILTLISKEMEREKSSQYEKTSKFIEQKEPSKIKKRIQLSLPENEYLDLETASKNSDSSMQYYIRCLVRKDLYKTKTLLGGELEVLRKSNYELHKLGVNINQITKAINTGERRVFSIEKVAEFVKNHTTLVEGILKDNG